MFKIGLKVFLITLTVLIIMFQAYLTNIMANPQLKFQLDEFTCHEVCNQGFIGKLTDFISGGYIIIININKII